MNKLFKVFSITLLSFLFFAMTIKPAYANYVSQTANEFGTQLEKGENNSVNYESMTKSGFDGFLYSGSCNLIGIACHSKLQLTDIQRSTVGQIGSGIAMFYTNPPADLAYWVVDTGHALGFLPQAYAQGVGFSGLQPLLNLWKAFRNISYVLVALAMVIVGFMIMFRRKIDPQTVVSIQNALPRIITTLILITFSYAIAGLMIDLMYVVMFVLLKIMQSAVPAVDSAQIRNLIQGTTDITYLDKGITVPIVGTILNNDQNAAGVLNILGRVMGPLKAFNFTSSLGTLGATGVGLLAGPGGLLIGLAASVIIGIYSLVSGTGPAGGALSPLLMIIFGIALFFVFLRIFFMLLGAYVQIIVGVITAPIQILLDVIPGSNGFLSWFMHLVTHLSTFVVVSVLLVLIGIISDNIGGGTLWSPPIIGSVDSVLLKALIGVGGMMMIPGVVKNIQQAFKAPSPFPVAAGMGGGLGAPLQFGMQILSLGASWRNLRGGQITQQAGIKPVDSGGGSGKKH